MKTLRVLIASLLLINCATQVGFAQKVKVDKAAEIAAIKEAIENQSFVFHAEYVEVPNHQNIKVEPSPTLTYELSFSDGVIESGLPNVDQNGSLSYYTGRFDSREGSGAQFKTNKYDYKLTKKSKGYLIVFIVKNALSTNRVAIDVTENGKYSTISITNSDYYIGRVICTGYITPIIKLNTNVGE